MNSHRSKKRWNCLIVAFVMFLVLFHWGCKTVEKIILTITSLTPAYGNNTGQVTVTIEGTGFVVNATVTLIKPGKFDIVGTVNVVSETQVTVVFDLNGASTGRRDLLVKNPDGESVTLVDTFQVLKPTVLYVVCTYGKNVLVYNSGDTVSGAVVPDRSLNNTQFGQPSDAFLDRTRNILYVSNDTGSKVLVFNNGSSVNGATAPDRVINSTVNISSLYSIYVDTASDQLYLSSLGTNTVLVFANASSASGTLVPARVITSAGIVSPIGIFLDTVGNRLYVANSGQTNCSISVFDNASTLNGAVSPSRQITTPELSPYLYDVFVDTVRNILYAAVANGRRLLVFQDASTVNGADVPMATIALSSAAKGLFHDSQKNILFVSLSPGSAEGSGSVLVFEKASALTASSLPVRTITNMTGPLGMWGTNE